VAFGIGLHQSFWSEYFQYWNNVVHLNFGLSFTYFPTPVSTVIGHSLPWTIILVGLSVIIAWVHGTIFGIIAGWRRGSTTDQLFNELGTSAPGWAEATSALDHLETVMVTQVPVIPMFVNSQQGIFNSSVATGFPTPSNPYAFASEINTELVVLHLKPRGH
jgi:ABC-type dipeptide/oligopeptide/nickel transport system permease component